MTAVRKSKRIRTVEYDDRWGWIARSPFDGHQLGGDGFYWRTRDVARTVVGEERMFGPIENSPAENRP